MIAQLLCNAVVVQGHSYLPHTFFGGRVIMMLPINVKYMLIL